MATSQSAIFMGDSQEDDGEKWAKLTLKLRHFNKNRDDVIVLYPEDVRSPLVVTVNSANIYNRRLPTAVDVKKCKQEIKYGDRGKIVLRLRKSNPCRWGDRWSPKHELPPSTSAPCYQPAAITDAENGVNDDVTRCQPMVTFPDEDDVMNT